MNHGLTKRDFEYIKEALKKAPEIEEAIVFGSRAKGNHKRGSDVDLAIKGKHINVSIVAKLSFELNEELPLPYYFDVVHYENISETKLVEHIDRVGKLVYSAKNDQRGVTDDTIKIRM